MPNQSRIKTVYKNSIITFYTQLFQIVLSFAVRKIFITTLGVTYLGYNSVLNNILQLLNLVDLEIGVVISSFLYRPLATEDHKRVSALMALYKKLYSIIGMVVLGVGIFISLFLGVIISDSNISIVYLRVLFYINLIGTVSTYFLAYKRTLIIADQKSYIANFVDTIVSVFIMILQIVLLLLYPNYMAYLILDIVKSIIANIVISHRCRRIYKSENATIEDALLKEYKPQMIQYIKDIFVSKVGAVVFFGTDNVIISIFRGSSLAGVLSNYTIITTYLSTIVSQILSSLQATFGNYINSDKNLLEQKEMIDNYLYANFIIGNFCMICFIFLAQPFIKLYFGQKLLLSFSTAVWLGINLMLTMLIQLPSQVFTIYKLFRYDRPIIIMSAFLNIGISAVLVKNIGVNGALIGTFFTSLIYLLSSFFIIARYVYKVSYFLYLRKLFSYFCISVITVMIVYIVTRKINTESWTVFAIESIILAAISFFVPIAMTSFSVEFSFLKTKMLFMGISKEVTSRVLVPVALLVIVISFFAGGVIKDAVRIDQSNKSTIRTLTYEIEKEDDEKHVFHFSIDDVTDCFQEIKKNEYSSIFQESTFAWFEEMHEKYGVVVSCYVYMNNGDFSLGDFTERYKEEFINNSDWLRFGFHTRSGDITYEADGLLLDYQSAILELQRIVGTESIDNVIRLQSFKGNYENIKAITTVDNEPIIGLFTADDDRDSYYLDKDRSTYIYSHDILKDNDLGITFISTDIRIEYVDNIRKKIMEFETDSWNNQLGVVEVFTHEWALNVVEKEKAEELFKWAVNKGYTFSFPEDYLK